MTTNTKPPADWAEGLDLTRFRHDAGCPATEYYPIIGRRDGALLVRCADCRIAPAERLLARPAAVPRADAPTAPAKPAKRKAPAEPTPPPAPAPGPRWHTWCAHCEKPLQVPTGRRAVYRCDTCARAAR